MHISPWLHTLPLIMAIDMFYLLSNPIWSVISSVILSQLQFLASNNRSLHITVYIISLTTVYINNLVEFITLLIYLDTRIQTFLLLVLYYILTSYNVNTTEQSLYFGF